MPLLRQKLLTDFYRPPGKCHESGTVPISNIICEPDYDADINCEGEGFSKPSSNCQLSITPAAIASSKIIRTIIVSGKENKKRRKMLVDDPKQMILDAGQKQFGHQQCKQVSLWVLFIIQQEVIENSDYSFQGFNKESRMRLNYMIICHILELINNFCRNEFVISLVTSCMIVMRKRCGSVLQLAVSR